MDEVIQLSVKQPRSTMWLFTAFAAIGMLLGMVGIYGVISHNVAQRTREIGIRMALGAERWDVLKMVLKEGAILTAAGVLIGLTGALALSRVVRSLLYGVNGSDPITFVLVAVLVSLAATLAAYLPSRRATRVDPTVALKQE
jgi:putative ABC transport system permease protein